MYLQLSGKYVDTRSVIHGSTRCSALSSWDLAKILLIPSTLTTLWGFVSSTADQQSRKAPFYNAAAPKSTSVRTPSRLFILSSSNRILQCSNTTSPLPVSWAPISDLTMSLPPCGKLRWQCGPGGEAILPRLRTIWALSSELSEIVYCVVQSRAKYQCLFSCAWDVIT